VINGNDEMRRQLWEGLGALRQELTRHPSACPQLGVLLASHSLPLHKAETFFVRNSVFQIPPLARDEVDEVLIDYLGQRPSQDVLDTFDKHAGGDPWFVFLLLRCLQAVTDSSTNGKEGQQTQAIMSKACALALSAVDQTGGGVPAKVQEEVEEYLQHATHILRLNRGALGSRQVLHAWKVPSGPFGRRQGIDEVHHAWMATGLVYPQAEGALRGVSLNSFKDYPAYQFSPAGDLPYRLAERVLVRARSEGAMS
jgi:hypothetical protein